MDSFNTIARMTRESRIMDQWKKIENIEERYAAAWAYYLQLAARHSDLTLALLDDAEAVTDAEYYKAVGDVTAAKLSLTSLYQEMCVAQDCYNELVAECTVREQPVLLDDEDDCAVADELCDMYDDIECCPRERKTRNDIMSLIEAVRAHKVQKHHKLKPRTVKRDRTKTPEGKTKTLRTRRVIVL